MKVFLLILLIFIGTGLALGAAFLFYNDLLRVESSPRHAEVIVVLGGESVGRSQKAIELFQRGVAPSIIVSGNGDALIIFRLLVQGGVPPGAIELEDRSTSTAENAEFTVRLLRKRGVREAVIVTSPFHSRRALNTFCFFAPEIHFSSTPAPLEQPWQPEATHVFQEYVKTAWYWVRYGISPWRSSE